MGYVMNRALCFLLALLVVTTRDRDVAAEELPMANFYVSPNGSDEWSGTLSEPDASGNDGPFTSLTRARDAVRQLGDDRAADVVVLLRGGTYLLDETVVFGVQDGGKADSTVTYAAYPGESPVFSSGREITGWHDVTGDLPGLPEEAIGKVQVADVSGKFLTLYDSDGMLPRAQSERFIPKGSAK